MHRKKYTVDELVQNPSFRQMVKGTASAEEVSRWNDWIEANDQNRTKARQAIAEIAGFEFDHPDQANMEKEWSRLYNTTIGKSDHKVLHIPTRNSSLKWIYRIAAILILASIVGVGLYLYPETERVPNQVEQITEERTIRTDPGEHKTVRFSNGSKIILNSNSTLTYSLGLLHSQTIEVTLEGEAFFDAESNAGENETVYSIQTPDGTIRDIGTEFLVTVWDDRSRIVLQEGLVEVEPLNQAGSNSQSEKVKFQVQKGEMVEFRRTDIITRRNVNPTFYSSWATGFLEFNQSGVHEFAEYVEKRFAVDVQLRDSSLKDIQLNGSVYFRSLDELMRSVSEVIGIPVYRSADRDTVYIGNLK